MPNQGLLVTRLGGSLALPAELRVRELRPPRAPRCRRMTSVIEAMVNDERWRCEERNAAAAIATGPRQSPIAARNASVSFGGGTVAPSIVFRKTVRSASCCALSASAIVPPPATPCSS